VQNNSPYFGALIGRFANRIKKGQFKLKGKTISLSVNEEATQGHLHGGEAGFSHKLFNGEIVEGDHGPCIVLTTTSPDGEMGYPGNLEVKVTISLTEENGLRYEYEASTDSPTIINLTAHPYFNLAGQDSGSVRQHLVQINAQGYLPLEPESATPTGKIEPVIDSPFDFREPTGLDHRLDSPHPQVECAKGFDHTFVFESDRDLDEPVATVIEEASGRKMDVYTSEPGVQFYTGNHLDGSIRGKNDAPYEAHAGLCLETQHFPDAPNHPDFPSTVLEPGKTFKPFTEYRFSAAD
jgi:aldose 1-epimerase